MPVRTAPVRKAKDPQRCLLLLHGVGSHGHQMPGMLTRFPRRGYSVLAPDSRAHGESEGLQVTYGRKEAQDLKLWVNWLEKQPGCQGGIYALGISMGAAVLLQALAEEPRIRAAVAESPFLSFAEIGANRLEQFAAPLGLVAPALVPLGMAWANWRHGVDLRLASPEIAAPRIKAPVLLIHGTQDSNIPPRHSEILLPRLRRARLWKVEGAEHAGCFGRDPAAYLAEVDEWFHSAR
ncbi:MAG: alpha/beta fold hydrolase [Bryobacter sp.]|nr:alpha/beta fold hydrolase [Bryobacter sp.]